MIYSFEEIDRENLARRVWEKENYIYDINHLIEMIKTLPMPCDEIEDCSSNYISGQQCQCQRGIFENGEHQKIYLSLLELYIFLLITDTLFRGYIEKKNHEINK